MVAMINAREKARPYIANMMKQASSTGRPPIRPLFFDFPSDINAAGVVNQYMFGDDLMVAPVMEYGVRTRMVYFPEKVSEGEDVSWTSYWDSTATYVAGTTHNVSAPFDVIPVFTKNDRRLK